MVMQFQFGNMRKVLEMDGDVCTPCHWPGHWIIVKKQCLMLYTVYHNKKFVCYLP